MKYYTWKTTFSEDEGSLIHPTSQLDNSSTTFELLFLSESQSLVYAALVKGEVDVSLLVEWDVQEVTEGDVLSAATSMDPLATIDQKTGLVVFASNTIPKPPSFMTLM